MDVKNRAENTPLYLAATGGHEATVRLLLDRGAEVNVENVVGKTPLHLAEKRLQAGQLLRNQLALQGRLASHISVPPVVEA